MHFDATSSAVMLPTAENMLCKETYESELLHDDSLILWQTFHNRHVRNVKKWKYKP